MKQFKSLYDLKTKFVLFLSFLLACLITTIRSLSSFITFFILNTLINKTTIIGLSSDFELIMWILIYVSFLIIDALSVVLLNFIIRIFIVKFTYKFQMLSYDKYYSSNIATLKTIDNNSVLNSISNDYSQYINNYLTFVLNVIPSIIALVCVIALMAYINWVILLAYLALSLFIMIYNIFSKLYANKLDIEKSIVNEKYLSDLNFKINNFDLYLNSGFRLPFISSIAEIFGYRNRVYKNIEIKKYALDIPITIINISSLLIIFGVSFTLQQYGLITIPAIIIAINNFSSFHNNFDSITSIVSVKNSLNLFRKKIDDFYLTFENNKDVIYKSNLEVISFEKVYLNIDNKNILNDINLTIEKGDKLLIKGKSGCGKSTLITLLFNEIETTSGSIKYNNKTIQKNINLSSQIAYANNNNFIVSGSLRDNIFLGRNPDETTYNDLVEKLEINYIKDETYDISTLNLSEGQKQKIVIARTLAQDKNFYVFDEAISNLDAKSKELLNKYFLQTNKTIIFISHISLNDKLFNKIYSFDVSENKWILE
ncbi:ATP-binding cassette domain-containing protein [Mycoplasma crocodyli]|uniref:Multidrug ABC transporter, ATP-binding protein n=1 Tax=Mycoplasma crocodyli (strain ATCC 51981 / MP145) TaxID=512564 RepID=D5E5T6_MYCCM|nr:ABC transporter ATP-binding protein [Mycoplasma crocodyli]ADE19655.1 multidrug ABC transporter, ATP-binding protein [Mycoplasma crocodyli MP145]